MADTRFCSGRIYTTTTSLHKAKLRANEIFTGFMADAAKPATGWPNRRLQQPGHRAACTHGIRTL